MSLLVLPPLIVLISYLLTGAMRQYSLSRNILDIPLDRSSHTVPTPRGGGMAIVTTFLGGLIASSLITELPENHITAFGGAALLAAVIGFWDDHRSISASVRLFFHFCAAAWGLYWLNGFPEIVILGYTLKFGYAGYAIGSFYLVWMLNLYNFMDGIDGLAAMEAITVSFGATLITWIAVPGIEQSLLVLLLLFSVLGFLIWNFPPAKIFMGDSGSCFLGLILGILSLQYSFIEPSLFWGWLILLGVFVVDATFTLVRRALTRKRLFEAHRTHAYQHATNYFGQHRIVSITVGFINLAWLLPISILVVLGSIDGFVGLLIAYAPLLILSFKLKAGTNWL